MTDDKLSADRSPPRDTPPGTFNDYKRLSLELTCHGIDLPPGAESEDPLFA